MKQISIFVENKVGSLAKVTTTLKEAQINIRAVSVFDSPEYSIMRLIVDDAIKAKSILQEKNFAVKTVEVLAVELEDQTGSLDSLLKIIEENNLNISYMYSFVFRKCTSPLLVLKTEYMEKATRIFEENNIRIIEKLD